jgi:hypothetical protein
VSATEVLATSPAESAGTVCVMFQYQGGGGASGKVADCEFTYVAASAVTGVSPTIASFLLFP